MGIVGGKTTDRYLQVWYYNTLRRQCLDVGKVPITTPVRVAALQEDIVRRCQLYPPWQGVRSPTLEGGLGAGRFPLVGWVPKGGNIVNSKRVLKWKTDANDEILKAKAKSAAQGFRQKYKMDFLQVLSPTANTATIRTLVVLVNMF